ncbi:WYL domain-containing protein, partial [Pseudomonas aeruginosa]|uniref:WYL domain-containing protein n=2 Tax=Pseudomonas TaxID=286 RepID=UPI000FF4BA2F
VQIRLRVSHTLSERLQENPLTDDQTLEPETTDWWLMSGSIHLSQGLDLWLLSQGEHLEVLEPTALRAQIAESAKRMAALYAGE